MASALETLIEAAADATTAQQPTRLVPLGGVWRSSQPVIARLAGSWYGRRWAAGELIASFVPTRAVRVRQDGTVFFLGDEIGVPEWAPVAVIDREIAAWAAATGEQPGSPAQLKAIKAAAALVTERRVPAIEAAQAARREREAAEDAVRAQAVPAWKLRAAALRAEGKL